MIELFNIPEIKNLHIRSFLIDYKSSFQNFVTDSIDYTPYHSKDYLSYSNQVNGAADLLIFELSGNPLFALPLHRVASNKFTTGYSGIIFSKKTGYNLKKAVDILAKFIECNKDKSFRIIQSAQSAGGNDHHRQALILKELSKFFRIKNNTYTRIIDLKKINNIDLEHSFKLYDSKLRSQLKSIASSIYTVKTVAYHEYNEQFELDLTNSYQLYVESRRDTSMHPRSLNEILAESKSLMSAGAVNIVVTALDENKRISSVVIAVLFDKIALYSMNFSTPNLKCNPNILCLHQALIEAKKLGAEYFELGRIELENATEKEWLIDNYKSQFGGGLIRVVDFEYKNKTDQFKAKLKKCFKQFIY